MCYDFGPVEGAAKFMAHIGECPTLDLRDVWKYDYYQLN